MRTSLFTARFGRAAWQILPWTSVRLSIGSLILVIFTAFIVDRWVLPKLEKKGLIAADGWKTHNQSVVANLHRKDRHVPFPKPKWASTSGVRAWTGFPVSKERKKKHRILVMGDSYVWESPYLTLNHMWWRQLEIELERRGYHDVEVNAAGCSGMSTHDELDLARHVVSEFQPDLILWGFVTNDPDERVVKQIASSQFSVPLPYRVQDALTLAVPRIFSLFKARRSDKIAKCYIGPAYGYEYSKWIELIHEGRNFELYGQTVRGVAEFMKEIGIPGMMVTLPEAPIPERFSFSYDKVLPLWEKSGIPIQNNLPEFVRRFPNVENTGPNAIKWGINPADGHPGPRTTSILAHLTADRLERDFLEILGKKSNPPVEIVVNDWLPWNLNVTKIRTGVFALTYPETEQLMPTMPLEIPTILLAFEQPVPLQHIHLAGSQLKSARIWVSTFDPVEFYDTQDLQDLGLNRGSTLEWTLPPAVAERKISTIQIQANFSGSERQLEIDFAPHGNRGTMPDERSQ